MLITIIGRGHSGTRAISATLHESGVFMGEPLNNSSDLIPPESMYDACRIFGNYVEYKGGCEWDFSKVLSMEPVPEFKALIEDYLSTVLSSSAAVKGWKIPETTLCYPWILKMFPQAHYIHWIRDPRDCILGSHVTDDLANFNIEYEKTTDERRRRAISWKYQRELMKQTPLPENVIGIRFEDMVYNQDETLRSLEKFLNLPLVKLPMRTDSVGRFLTDTGEHDFAFFDEDLAECGYIK